MFRARRACRRPPEHRPPGLCAQRSSTPLFGARKSGQNVRLAHRPVACVPNSPDADGSGGRAGDADSCASAIIHGARNASATPIIRTLHINAPAPCSMVRRMVAGRPDPLVRSKPRRLSFKFRAKNLKKFCSGSRWPRRSLNRERDFQAADCNPVGRRSAEPRWLDRVSPYQDA